jgi:CDP-diglyceride synthetase
MDHSSSTNTCGRNKMLKFLNDIPTFITQLMITVMVFILMRASYRDKENAQWNILLRYDKVAGFPSTVPSIPTITIERFYKSTSTLNMRPYFSPLWMTNASSLCTVTFVRSFKRMFLIELATSRVTYDRCQVNK